MVFKYIEILGEIIFTYVAERPNISHVVAEISNFVVNPEECPYFSINIVVRRFIQDP